MLIPICLLIAFFVVVGAMSGHSKRSHRLYRQFKTSAVEALEAQKSALTHYGALGKLYEKLLREKDLLIIDLQRQVGNLKEAVENLSDLSEDEDEEEMTEERDLVHASSLYDGSVLDQRIATANAMINLYEANSILEAEKKHIPKATYEKLSKHLRMDS